MIPFIDYGGNGTSLHFLHANGYPPNCYQPLLERFATQHQTFGMLLRPLWTDSKPEEIQDWKPFSEDLIQLLDERKLDSVIGTLSGIVSAIVQHYGHKASESPASCGKQSNLDDS